MSRRCPIGWFTLAGTASGGVILGHWLAYVAAIPAQEARARILSATGHGYWPAFFKSLPLLLVFLSIWTAAEFVGYLAGEGDSSRKVV